MSREQFFKPNIQNEPETEKQVAPEKLADWEIEKDRHLAAKEAFHKERAATNQTGKEKYLDNKYKKHIKNLDKSSA